MRHNLFIFVLLCQTMAYQIESIQTNFPTDEYDLQGWIVSNGYGQLKTYCRQTHLFGGYDSFGANTIISKQFSLPPHYKLEITFELWIIDYWYNDIVIVIIDDTYWNQSYHQSPNQEQCENSYDSYQNSYVEKLLIDMNHTQESLIFIMTSNLQYDARQSSWGLRDLTFIVYRCPQGCLYCSDNDYNNCYYWIGFLSLWHESMVLDGWMKNDNTQPVTYKCVSFDLVKLAPSDKLEKMIENLTPHYKIQITAQLWKIDKWNNENFELLVDDQIQKQIVLQTTGIYSICGSTGSEQIINIAVTLPHSLSQCKITMRTNHNAVTTNAYWGIRAFNLYLAKCHNVCDQCFGPLKTECTACSNGWILYNKLCTNSPPMLLSQISNSQIKDPQSDDRISIEINLLEVDQQINTQGNFTLSVKNPQKFLTIQVYVKCLSNTRIKSQFQSNKLQDLQQYSFFTNCQQAFNTVIFNVKYKQRIITQQEMIINTSDTQCVIYQVIKAVDEIPYVVKILEIIIEHF